MVEAAGGGEKSTNAELVFSATCSTVRVLYLLLTPQAGPRQLRTCVEEFHLFMTPHKRLVSLFLIQIPQSMPLFPPIAILGSKKCYFLNDNKLRMTCIYIAMIKELKTLDIKGIHTTFKLVVVDRVIFFEIMFCRLEHKY